MSNFKRVSNLKLPTIINENFDSKVVNEVQSTFTKFTGSESKEEAGEWINNVILRTTLISLSQAEKIAVTILNLKGKALEWALHPKISANFKTWKTFVEAFQKKFVNLKVQEAITALHEAKKSPDETYQGFYERLQWYAEVSDINKMKTPAFLIKRFLKGIPKDFAKMLATEKLTREEHLFDAIKKWKKHFKTSEFNSQKQTSAFVTKKFGK